MYQYCTYLYIILRFSSSDVFRLSSFAGSRERFILRGQVKIPHFTINTVPTIEIFGSFESYR